MTIDEVAKLIECCKNAGVSRLKFEKLDVSFLPKDPTPVLPQASPIRAIEREIEDDPDLNELEMQNLAINEPLTYESYLISRRKQGDVEDGQ